LPRYSQVPGKALAFIRTRRSSLSAKIQQVSNLLRLGHYLSPKLMKEYCFTVECGSQTITLVYVTREFEYLVGKQCPEGTAFIQAVGMWDNFSVARGQDTEAWTAKSRMGLLNAAESLLKRVRADRDFINYDYQCGFSAEGPRRYSGRGFGVMLPGKVGATVWLNPGQITMDIQRQGEDGKFLVVESRDLRRSGPIQTADKGTLKVYRRFNPINWEQKLPPLIDFLANCSCENVRIRHHYPPSQTKKRTK
jgi:hypothetical protein